jgi:hypothetical protein
MQASSPQLARPNASQHMRLQALPRNAAKPMMARRAVFSQALRVQHTETLSTQLLSSLPAGLQVSTTALAYTSLSTAILVGASYASRSQLVLLLAAVLAVIGYQLRQQPQQPSTSDATTAKGGSVRILSEATRPKEAVIGQAASQLIAQQVGRTLGDRLERTQRGYRMLALKSTTSCVQHHRLPWHVQSPPHPMWRHVH